jgi:hypothetical protein
LDSAIDGCRHPVQGRMKNPALNIRDDLAGIDLYEYDAKNNQFVRVAK